MIDYTYNQFVEEEPKPYFDGDYVCHGSTLSFNPEQDNQLILMFDEWLSKSIPMIKQDPNYNYTMANALINNAGGSIKKNKDILLKPLKDQLDLEQATSKIILEIKAEGRKLGLPEAQIKAKIDEVLQGLKGGGQGLPPQGQPPMPQAGVTQ
jgi:hypothetical protein